MTTRVAGATPRICVVASIPDIPGMLRSISTTSGAVCPTSSAAPAPSEASPTTSMPCSTSSSRSPLRNSAWSSASTTRALEASSIAPARLPAFGLARQRDQQPNAVSRRALADVFPPHVPRGAGDVEVNPRNAVDELLQERRGVDRSCLALLRRVDQVGHGALGEVLVL